MTHKAASFVRVGKVRARRLTGAREWTTTNGDVLRGGPGDWLVTSQDGGLRTVKDPQFRDSYKHLRDDVWERTGQVTALQADARQSLETLEGTVSAQPGDWIVTAADGSTWVVPDVVFRRSYRPSGGDWGSV